MVFLPRLNQPLSSDGPRTRFIGPTVAGRRRSVVLFSPHDFAAPVHGFVLSRFVPSVVTDSQPKSRGHQIRHESPKSVGISANVSTIEFLNIEIVLDLAKDVERKVSGEIVTFRFSDSHAGKGDLKIAS